MPPTASQDATARYLRATSNATGTRIAVLGLRKINDRATPAAISFLSRRRRHPTTEPAATRGTTCPRFTACSTHQGVSAPSAAIQRLVPVLRPAQINPAANDVNMSTAQIPYATQ